MLRNSQFKQVDPPKYIHVLGNGQGHAAGFGKGWWSFVARVRRDILAGLYRDHEGRALVLADPADIEARLKARRKEDMDL